MGLIVVSSTATLEHADPDASEYATEVIIVFVSAVDIFVSNSSLNSSLLHIRTNFLLLDLIRLITLSVKVIDHIC